jgi:DNA-binding NarL/FixJ family response regulator
VDALHADFLYAITMREPIASVLIIESHPLMREALYAAIAMEPGLSVAALLTDSAQAAPVAQALQPDLILMALGNPGLDDLQALSNLRLALPAVPILALTTGEVADQEQAAADAGASVVITKAAPRAELIRVLHTLLTPQLPAQIVNRSQPE